MGSTAVRPCPALGPEDQTTSNTIRGRGHPNRYPPVVMNKSRLSFSISTLLWLTACVAVFCIGWRLEPPGFFKNQKHVTLTTVSGPVLRVKGNLVAIAVGADDGVRQNHKVKFYRDGNLIGRGLVENVTNNMCSCRICSGKIDERDVANVYW